MIGGSVTALQAERVSPAWAWPFALPTGPRVLRHVLLLSRLLTLALIGAFASVAGHLDLLSFSAFQPWWLMTIASASLFSWAQFAVPARYAAVVPLVEAIAALLIVVFAGAAGWPLVVYLVMAPVFAGIAAGGWLPVLVATGQLAALSVILTLDRSP